MTSRPLYAVVLLLSLAACGGGASKPDVLPRSRFVAANVALRLLPADATEAQRRAALKKLGVTDKQMLGWVDAHRADPKALAEAWQDVAHRVDSLSALRPPTPAADSAKGDSALKASRSGAPPVVAAPPVIAPPADVVRPGRVSPFDSLAKSKAQRRAPVDRPRRSTTKIQ